jgi:excisionase family DNA binding protein
VEAWSVRRVAEILHVSEDTVRRLITAAEFPGTFRVGVGRKLIRIPITDLDAYQQRQRVLADGAGPGARADHDDRRRVGSGSGALGYPGREKGVSSSYVSSEERA